MGVDMGGQPLCVRAIRELVTIQAALAEFPSPVMCMPGTVAHEIRVEVEPGQEQALMLFLIMRCVRARLDGPGAVTADTHDDAGHTIGRAVARPL